MPIDSNTTKRRSNQVSQGNQSHNPALSQCGGSLQKLTLLKLSFVDEQRVATDIFKLRFELLKQLLVKLVLLFLLL